VTPTLMRKIETKTSYATTAAHEGQAFLKKKAGKKLVFDHSTAQHSTAGRGGDIHK